MWRRQAKGQEQVRAIEPEEVRRRWAEWEARWNPDEEQRVARWLSVKSAGEASEAGLLDMTCAQMDWTMFETQESQQVQPDREISASVDALKVELAALHDERNKVTAALTEERSELAGLAHQRQQLAADLEAERVEVVRQKALLDAELEAERVDLQEQRRRLAAPLQHLIENRQLLEAEVASLAVELASLEDRRREILEEMDTAVATAERARQAELAAVAHLAEMQEHAKQVEKEQFDIWVALDAEVTALRNHVHDGGADGI